MPKDHANRRIAIFAAALSSSARGLLQGISAYARPGKPWTFRWTMHAPAVIPQLRAWRPDGIFAFVTTNEVRRRLQAIGVPVVDLANHIAHPTLPLVTWDEKQTGRIAAAHLLARGLRHFAFLGFGGRVASEQREAGFREALREAGFDCARNVERGTDEVEEHTPSWSTIEKRLRVWVESLPKPVGILAAVDGYAIELEEMCHEAGIRVPEEVAVVGVGNDDVACAASYPPLSSVHLHGQRVGYEAAALLDRLMSGGRAPRRPLLLPPGEVAARQSSDVVAIDDPGLAEAARFIRLHAHEGIIVKDVLSGVAVERRELERGFRRVFGRSPLQEIHRVKTALARQMLETTDLPMPVIAPRAGFPESKKMAIIFKRVTGMTPSEYRRRFRVSG